MALSVRGRAIAIALVTVTVASLVVAFLVAGGNAGQRTANPSSGPTGGQTSPASPSPSPSPTGPPPEFCPLSGERPEEGVPLRPVLAVKVENLPTARPQSGLSWADIVYEEPVEGGISRFIAVYQCHDAERVEPIRSARLTDVDILVQFGRPLLAYSGGVPQVIRAIRDAGLIELTEDTAAQAFHRDPEREAPHDLYSDTVSLYAAAGSTDGPPAPAFAFSAVPPVGGEPVSEASIPITFAETPSWRWDDTEEVWGRYEGDEPHLLSDGSPITARNVVIQVVELQDTYVVDPITGARSPKVISVGSGTVYVLRAGRVYEGTWQRRSHDDLTTFTFPDGAVIPLAVGNTWIELAPTKVEGDAVITFTP